jgi:hypothetical protein
LTATAGSAVTASRATLYIRIMSSIEATAARMNSIIFYHCAGSVIAAIMMGILMLWLLKFLKLI